ncbi:MAG TPA: hypothetical protein VKU79_00505 [Thermoplasmataceae archaeon]|nr:hypothetical protein [Thermoplasmataceae archaeon]
MVVVRDLKSNTVITSPEKARSFLERFGVGYEFWSIKDNITESTSPSEILSTYSTEIEDLKKRGGYVTADVIDINSATPGLDEMLEKFNKEHFHSEDEVRFTVLGHGIFHLHSAESGVISVEVSAGDMLRVPRGMRHWFDLCEDRKIKAVRLFQDRSGWTPYYVENGVHVNFMPVCFGPAFIRPLK